MKLYDFQHPEDPSDPLERDGALWDLLGQARPVEVSPLFSRNVLREIRLARQPAPSSLSSIFKWWRPVLIGVTGIAVVVINGLVLLQDHDSSALQHADVEAIKNLDELLAYEPTEVWLDKSVY